MYSIVLLAGMTAGSDNTPPVAPAVGVPVAGCSGCYGSACYGSSCYGTVVYGSCHGHGRGIFGHRGSCQGCTGYSCSGYSCFGSCNGCTGYMPPYMYGYGYGYYGYGYGYSGGSSVYGSYSYPGAAAPVVVPVEGGTKFDPATPPKVEDKKDPTKPKSNESGMGANLKFVLPANAKLYVDGRLTGGNGNERTFFTPPLAPGQKYFYEVKAEIAVGGEVVVEEKRVIVSAGENVVETFPKLNAAVEKASTVAGK